MSGIVDKLMSHKWIVIGGAGGLVGLYIIYSSSKGTSSVVAGGLSATQAALDAASLTANAQESSITAQADVENNQTNAALQAALAKYGAEYGVSNNSIAASAQSASEASNVAAAQAADALSATENTNANALSATENTNAAAVSENATNSDVATYDAQTQASIDALQDADTLTYQQASIAAGSTAAESAAEVTAANAAAAAAAQQESASAASAAQQVSSANAAAAASAAQAAALQSQLSTATNDIAQVQSYYNSAEAVTQSSPASRLEFSLPSLESVLSDLGNI